MLKVNQFKTRKRGHDADVVNAFLGSIFYHGGLYDEKDKFSQILPASALHTHPWCSHSYIEAYRSALPFLYKRYEQKWKMLIDSIAYDDEHMFVRSNEHMTVETKF